MNYEIIAGDALQTLKTLPANSVQTCVTSPPYYGLRDYGTATWEGGDAACDHVQTLNLKRDTSGGVGANGRDKGTRGEQPHSTSSAIQYRDLCGKCGARRIDSQVGLEESPELYVAKLVDVFREVRRVLHPTGTVWLNLGSSYASSDTRSSQSRHVPHVPAYDNDGKESQDFLDADRAYHDSCDVPTSETQNHHGHNVRSDQSAEQGEPLPLPTSHDNGHLDSGSLSQSAFVRGVQESTIPESSFPLPGASFLASTASADQLESGSFGRDVQESDHRAVNIPDKSLISQTLDDRKSDRELLDSALSSPMDSAALTYLYSTIASLDFQSKQLIPIPWLVALALQADGWILRQDIIWDKGNPMPESVTDRCTKSHEYIFLLSKSARYYFDNEAIKEKAKQESYDRYKYAYGGAKAEVLTDSNQRNDGYNKWREPSGRNKRSVWRVNTRPYAGAHFAVFPEALITPCILAGTSAHGCCANCGAPWERITERTPMEVRPGPSREARSQNGQLRTQVNGTMTKPPTSKTVGWAATCACGCTDVVPCVVLDCFSGSGTTGAVALKHNRHYIGLELNPEYIELSHKRIGQAQPLLPLEGAL